MIISCLFSQNNLLTGAINGNPLNGVSIYDIEFVQLGGDLVLAVGDYNSGEIVAIDFNWSDTIGVNDWDTANVPNIRARIAPMVGTTASNLSIRDMKVNPKTKAVLMLMYNLTARTTFLVEVKSQSNISLVNLINKDYCVMSYTANNNYIFDMAWSAKDSSLYYTTGDFTLDAEIGFITMPFNDGDTGTLAATTLFKSNWGGNYFTSAPLEMISISDVDGTNRLMGVTTCAPGFSIPTSTIVGTGVLSVTEDFNVNNDYSLAVVTQAQGTGAKTTYLFDLHINQTVPGPTQLIRVGEKYLDGSRATVNEINSTAKKLRTSRGDMTPGLPYEDAVELSTGFFMIAKYSEYELMVVDDNEVLRLMDVTSSTVGIKSNSLELAKLNIYPSPASDFIQFQLNLEGDKNLMLKIWDMEGKVVYYSNWNQEAINISKLSNGGYIANVQKDGIQIAQGKFIKR